jgi:hypothetical protein
VCLRANSKTLCSLALADPMAKIQCAQLCKQRYLLDCEADWPWQYLRVPRVQWSKYLNPPKNRRVSVSTFNTDVRLNARNQIVNKTINERWTVVLIT